MNKSLLKIAAATVFAFLLSNVSLADPITGTMGFTGNFSTDNNANFTAATQFTSFNVLTYSGTGDYSSVGAFDAVSFTPFSFTATGVTPLWTFTDSGLTYTFSATSVNVTTGSNFIIAEGNGIAGITGLASTYDNTAGTWIITGNGIGGESLTFSATTAVPDGSTTAVLLGISLVGMCAFAGFRRAKAKV